MSDGMGKLELSRGSLASIIMIGALLILDLGVHVNTFWELPTRRLAPSARLPDSSSPLAQVVRNYQISLPTTLWSLSQQVKQGKVTDKESAVRYTRNHAKPLADALDATFAAHSDAEGRFTDAEGLAAELAAAAQAANTGNDRSNLK